MEKVTTEPRFQRSSSKCTLRQEIRNYIQSQIVSGIYRAGDRIVETQLARELNVSQAPVREAILELASMGLLEERPYSGTFVRKLSPEDIEDIYNTRAFIEEYAARQAAKRATSEQLHQMKNLLHQMETADSYRTFAQLDIAFHALIVDAAGSPALKRAWNYLLLGEWTSLSVAVTQSTLTDLVRQHRSIYNYLCQREERSAGAYMFLHIKNFGEEMIQHYQEWSADLSDLPNAKH
ncbi:GntR family transcriptional regulator [uncultured Oscillibacter sp.]|uniref:GntR family transcriptional regulator n=1 Tax=uncultured Oscillibacter sp. TaxID=876091 RepID=UPI0025F81292|nr:GntR family transcriptional regulator [uncultured Oscillibacter sp.]